MREALGRLCFLLSTDTIFSYCYHPSILQPTAVTHPLRHSLIRSIETRLFSERDAVNDARSHVTQTDNDGQETTRRIRHHRGDVMQIYSGV